MKPLITNIQRFCVHDGPGIRTTVFFKGCTLHCPWCANPENIHMQKEVFYIPEKCMDNCEYTDTCIYKNTNKELYQNELRCPYCAIGEFGKYFTQEELYREILKDLNFYGMDGGVTFSGGEPLLFLPDYQSLCQKLHERGITVCVETALFVSSENIEWAVNNVDIFYVDIKLLDEEKCKNILGGSLQIFMNNLQKLNERINEEKMLIYRIPLASGITDTDDNLKRIVDVISEFPASYVEVFKVHNLAQKKYERLGRNYANVIGSDDARVEKLLGAFAERGIIAELRRL